MGAAKEPCGPGQAGRQPEFPRVLSVAGAAEQSCREQESNRRGASIRGLSWSVDISRGCQCEYRTTGTHSYPSWHLGRKTLSPWNLHAASRETGDPELTKNMPQVPGQNRNGIEGNERKLNSLTTCSDGLSLLLPHAVTRSEV